MTTEFSPTSSLIAPQRRTHELQVWPGCFEAVEAGQKPFDVRQDDRHFEVGDVLLLREYEPETEQYTGRSTTRWISHLLRGGQFGIEAGWCVLGFSPYPPLPPGVMDTKLW